MLKRFIQFLNRRSPPLLLREGIAWDRRDGEAMRLFWQSNTGAKLRVIADDLIYVTATSGRFSADFIAGQISMRDGLLNKQAPAPKVAEDLNPDSTTIQEQN